MAQIKHIFHGRELAIVILSLLSISVFAQKKPTLMILPSDNWCTQRYFTTTYENQGETPCNKQSRGIDDRLRI